MYQLLVSCHFQSPALSVIEGYVLRIIGDGAHAKNLRQGLHSNIFRALLLELAVLLRYFRLLEIP